MHNNVVVQINTILWNMVEKPVNVLLYGILAAFDEEITVHASVRKDGTIEVVMEPIWLQFCPATKISNIRENSGKYVYFVKLYEKYVLEMKKME